MQNLAQGPSPTQGTQCSSIRALAILLTMHSTVMSQWLCGEPVNSVTRNTITPVLMSKGNRWKRQLMSLSFPYHYIDKNAISFPSSASRARKRHIFRGGNYPDQYELELYLNPHFPLLLSSY